MQTGRTMRRSAGGQQALLSHSTILILSGYLIGAGSVPGSLAGMGAVPLLAGVCGLICYAGLRLAVRYRVRRESEQAIHRALRNLDLRIHRHISRPGLLRRPRRRSPGVRSEQYLAVVRSGRGR